MKTLKYVIPIVLAILVSGVIAGDKDKDKNKDKLSGTVAEKAKDAKEGVAVVLKVKNGDKETVVNLLATDKAAEKLVKAIGKKVDVTGVKIDDTNFKVSDEKCIVEKTEKKGCCGGGKKKSDCH